MSGIRNTLSIHNYRELEGYTVNWMKDDRIDCWSVMTEMSVGDYLDMVTSAHRDRGGIQGQRDVLKTTTAKRIRDRMISDIRHGAVLPPVVLGAVVNNRVFSNYPLSSNWTFKDLFSSDAKDSLAIIDGMQRTGALLQAVEGNPEILGRQVRVEFWLTRSVRAMVYRMLVLNTGQVPWTLSRQLEVVYAQLIKEIKERVPDITRVLGVDNNYRRIRAGEFASDDLVELYIAFSLRKTTVDTKEALSEEFSRLDFVENLSRTQFQEQFYACLKILAALDKAFSQFDPSDREASRYSRGRNIFDSQPARIGFMTAVAQHALGRPGMDRREDETSARISQISTQAMTLVDKLNGDNATGVGEFLALDVLRERLNVRSGQVGRFERSVFFEAFKVLIDEKFALSTMEPCWRAH